MLPAALPATATSAHPTRGRERAARAHATDAHRRLPLPLLHLPTFAPIAAAPPPSPPAASPPPAPRLTPPSPVVAADCRFGILRSNVSLHLSLAMQPTPSPPPAAADCPFGSSFSNRLPHPPSPGDAAATSNATSLGNARHPAPNNGTATLLRSRFVGRKGRHRRARRGNRCRSIITAIGIGGTSSRNCASIGPPRRTRLPPRCYGSTRRRAS